MWKFCPYCGAPCCVAISMHAAPYWRLRIWPPLAWRHRHNVSAYDAMYVVVARMYDVPLLTADGPLARAPALGIVVQNIRMA